MIAILFVKEFCDERKENENTDNNVSIKNYDLIWTGILVVLIVLFGITGTGNFLYANFYAFFWRIQIKGVILHTVLPMCKKYVNIKAKPTPGRCSPPTLRQEWA